MAIALPRARQTRCAAIARSSRPIWARSKMLEVNGLSAGYGSTQVLQDVSLHVAPGESVCLIGANGAGKTTLLRCIAGLLPARAGRISVSGRDVGTASASARLGWGIGLVPAARRVFATIRRLNTEGISILLAEQNANMALRGTAQGYVLAEGAIVRAAQSSALVNDPLVRTAYLGL